MSTVTDEAQSEAWLAAALLAQASKAAKVVMVDEILRVAHMDAWDREGGTIAYRDFRCFDVAIFSFSRCAWLQISGERGSSYPHLFVPPPSNNEKIPALLAPLHRCATTEPRGGSTGRPRRSGPMADASNCRK